MKLFVYGTLMSGGPGNQQLRGCTLLGPAVTRGKLYNLGWFPGLKDGDEGDVVKGEVWEVPNEIVNDVVNRLDQYEGYRPGDIYSLFVRQLMLVDREDPKTGMSWEEDAWTYMFNRHVDENQLIVSGDWRNRGVKDAKVREEDSSRVAAGG